MSKITNDTIHGTIELNNILFMIIDTPQFQRLRNIKQLGGCYFLYPGASHNRFEHSIGVCYLAGKLARHLQNDKNRMNVEIASQINISDDDVLCIEIAGLCHDLGHGPYSHLYDMLFKKAMQKKDPSLEWKHEDVSKDMFRQIHNENESLKTELFKKFGEKTEKRIEFILNLITGEIPEEEIPERKFMYEIVANHRNGIDVDKMDYFARDGQALGIKYTFDHERYFANCRVMFIRPDSKETTIAVRDKEMFNLYELFHTRIGLFRRAYYHKVTKAVELMATDVLVEANDVIDIPYVSSDGNVKSVKMHQAWNHIPAFQLLTDSIFDLILMKGVGDARLQKATELINRIYSRKLYELVLETEPNSKVSEKYVEKFILDKGEGRITVDDFSVQKVVFNYGMKEKNPITEVYFFKKKANDCYKRDNPAEISLFLPSETFQEEFIRVYSKCLEKTEDIKNITKELEFERKTNPAKRMKASRNATTLKID